MMTIKILKTTAIALAMALPLSSAQAQERLTMGATHSASSFYAYQVGISNYLNNSVEGIDINVRELGGAEVSTEALLRDEIDMGISVTASDYAAVRGNEPFQQPAGNLRTLYFFAPLPLNFVVATKSGIATLAELEGQAFNPGGRGTSTEAQVDKIFETLGISPDVSRAEGNDALDAFQNRKIVGFVKGGIHPDGYIQQAASSREIHVLPFTEEQRNALSEAYPFFSSTVTKPDEFYGDSGGDVNTVQTAIGINTTSALPEEVAYNIAKAVFSEEGKTAASEVYSPAANIDAAQLTIDAAVAPLHAGVVKYLKEEGYDVPDNLIAD